MIAVPVETSPSFAAGNAEVLFQGQAPTLGGRGYDVSPDGQRFLMLMEVARSEGTSTAPHFIIVQNWFEDLRRLVPTN